MTLIRSSIQRRMRLVIEPREKLAEAERSLEEAEARAAGHEANNLEERESIR